LTTTDKNNNLIAIATGKKKFIYLLILLGAIACIAVLHTLTSTQDNDNKKPALKASPDGQAILLIGDSHVVGNFGHALTDIIATKLPESTIITVASCGSTPRWWLTRHKTMCGFWRHDSNGHELSSREYVTPKLESLLDEIKPELIIIALGTNLFFQKHQIQRSEITSILNEIKGKVDRCIWVGPPDTRNFNTDQINSLYNNLEELTTKSGCRLFDSRKYTSYPQSESDGIHYDGVNGRRISREWAENIFNNELIGYK
jgi:hypothetical protein